MPRKKPRRKMGRPSKLTPELARRICTIVRGGNYLETAASSCGVDPATLRRWLRSGARAKDGIQHDFCAAVEKATSDAEKRDIAVITAASKKQWTAAAWRLERRHPERWAIGQRIRDETEKRIAEMVRALKDGLPDVTFRQVLALLALVDDAPVPEGARRERGGAELGADGRRPADVRTGDVEDVPPSGAPTPDR